MIIKKFQEQVNKTPNKLAVKCVEGGYTYLLLDKYSSKVAYQLSCGVNNHDSVPVIGLLFEHGVDMILSILGALKAGIIYVPLSPKYPKNRLQYMIEHSGASVIATNTANANIAVGLFEDTDKIINIDDEASYNNEVINIVNDEAYIMYTSGSTGRPKGVIQTQKSIYYYSKDWANLFNIDSSDNLTLFSSFFHDGSVQDIFTSLLSGATLYPYDVMKRDDSLNFKEFLLKENITIWHSVPSLYGHFLNMLTEPVNNSSLKYILLGGEAIRKYEIDASNKYFKNVPLVSIYGQTESSVNSTCILNGRNKVTLGKTLSETKIFLIDENNEIVEPLSKGEIIIASDYISPGYWNVENNDNSPFIDSSTLGKLYKTGDIGRLLVNGDIEFLGRKDNQIKIRGFRIELGEIENVLLNHENVKESVVIAREEKEEIVLCAYVVLWQKQSQEDLRSYLIGLLPDYMIPLFFVELEKLPLTANGKVNRLDLPIPEIKADAGYLAPKNLIETKLVKIWSEVLKLASKEISTNASFFELGGHSLNATVLVSLIHKELEVRIELRDIFQYRTIQGQAELINSLESTSYFSIPKAKIQEYYPLSSSQRRLYLLQQMYLESTAYNMPNFIAVPEGQSRQQIMNIFNTLIARHENFRTSFEVVDQLPVQRIHSEVSFSIKEYQITKAELSSVRKDFVQAFDLSLAPLLRVAYLEVDNGEDMLLVDMHHIISDGRSHAILKEEFFKLISGKDLAPLPLQYKDYSQWQNSKEQQERIKTQETYWLNKFTGELPVLELPTDNSRPAIQSFEGASVNFVLSTEETKIIHNICKEQGITVYMSLLSVFTILLSKLSGQEDIIVGSPIAARRHSDLEDIVGVFVNTLAIRNEVSGDKQLIDYLQELKENILEASENQEYQFEDLIENIVSKRDTSRNPIFDVMFNMLNHTEYNKDLTEIKSQDFIHTLGISKFDLSLTAIDLDSEIVLSFEYCTKLFQPENIERFINYFRQLIQSLSGNYDQCLKEINILPEEEKQQLLYEFNNTKVDYPKNKTIHQLFEEQAEKTPDKTAVCFENLKLSYFELNSKSNLLANFLIHKGYTNTLIGLMTTRSIEMIIGILGILKSGNSYLPLDASHPKQRNALILEESGVELLLTNIKGFQEDNITIIDLCDLKYEKNNLIALKPTKSSDIAYIIYTSGSTGVPKGVMIEHRNVVNLLTGVNKITSIKSSDVLLSLTTVSFDIFGLELYTPLINGATLLLASDEEQNNIEWISSVIIKNKVSILQLTPSRLQIILYDETLSNVINEIGVLLVGGEELPEALLSEVRKLYKGCIYNMYGPTETTIWSTYKDVSGTLSLNIGKPIVNTQIYILGNNNDLKPVGVIGELCISGDGLARGYYKNEELTAKKFIDHPFIEGERLYRTGDLARWLLDGNIDFLGRIDHQVKIRGFRIELGEIESCILSYEEVRECAVIARKDKEGDNYLCAYIISNREEQKLEELLRTHLSGLLPDYMIPSYIVELEKIPLNSNGKVDRKSLPEPEIKAGADYVAPSTELEYKLVHIWSSILNIAQDNIGLDSDFFSIGGHSLKAAMLVSQLKEELDVNFSLLEFFQANTIRKMVKIIEVRKMIDQGISEKEIENDATQIII